MSHNQNLVLVANRGMALLALKKYAQAEVDCTTVIEVDPTHVKCLMYSNSSTL